MPDSNELQEKFRLAMRRLATSVSVMTLQDKETRHGITLTSATSISMDPSSMIVCIAKTAAIYASLSEGQGVTISLLTAEQKEVSEAFAWSKKGEDRFTVGEWSADPQGRPILKEAQSNLMGKIEKVVPYGTHGVVIISLDAVEIQEQINPLLYMDGTYLTAQGERI
ncbi:MAG: flavin reductase family protein [Magnetococcales bacterium]|nr:flavin reductase family protein [Magnetococcales bacterium]